MSQLPTSYNNPPREVEPTREVNSVREADEGREISLPQLDGITPILKLAETEPLPQVPVVKRPEYAADVSHLLEGQPFHPMKVLNHYEQLKAIADGKNPYPVTVEIDPSNKCNHRCDWCVSSLAHTGEYLEFEHYEELVGELKTMGVASVVLKGGGEPTVHPDINRMLYLLKEQAFGIGMITNGSLPRKDTIDAIVDCADWVRFSVDGANAATHAAIHGTKDFDKVMKNIRVMAERATRTLLGMNFVCEQRNYNQIIDFAALAKATGVAYASIRCVFDPENPMPIAVRQLIRRDAQLAKQLEDDSFRVFLGNFSDEYIDASAEKPFAYEKCLGPNMVGVVGAEGEVYACCFLRGNKEFSFGNVNEDSFESIWNSEKRQDVMERVYKGECGYACNGGMTSNRYNTYNQILNYMQQENKTHANFV